MLMLSLFLLFNFIWATILQAQNLPTTPLGQLIYAVLTPVVGWSATKAYDGIKTILPWWDKQPAIYHQIAAPLFLFGFGWLASNAGFSLISDISGIDAAWLDGGFMALLGSGIYRWEKKKTAADATLLLEQSRNNTVA